MIILIRDKRSSNSETVNHLAVRLSMISVCLLLCPSGEPTNDPNVQGDPFKTLFVGRIVSNFYKNCNW